MLWIFFYVSKKSYGLFMDERHWRVMKRNIIRIDSGLTRRLPRAQGFAGGDLDLFLALLEVLGKTWDLKQHVKRWHDSRWKFLSSLGKIMQVQCSFVWTKTNTLPNVNQLTPSRWHFPYSTEIRLFWQENSLLRNCGEILCDFVWTTGSKLKDQKKN